MRLFNKVKEIYFFLIRGKNVLNGLKFCYLNSDFALFFQPTTKDRKLKCSDFGLMCFISFALFFKV